MGGLEQIPGACGVSFLEREVLLLGAREHYSLGVMGLMDLICPAPGPSAEGPGDA
jgi:hypothetical protein